MESRGTFTENSGDTHFDTPRQFNSLTYYVFAKVAYQRRLCSHFTRIALLAAKLQNLSEASDAIYREKPKALEHRREAVVLLSSKQIRIQNKDKSSTAL